tara:strand:+ start:180 stop:431 length:252 start_codon:yes stop_codon:yes gene_type:complete
MFNKICQVASLLSLLLSGSMAAFGFVAIRYMQSPEFERTLKNKLMGSLENKMPDVMKNTLPDFTGPSIEIPKKQVSPLGNTQN